MHGANPPPDPVTVERLMHEAVRAIDALDRPGSLKKTHLPYPSLSQRIIEIMIFVFPVDILLIRGPAFDEDGPGSRVQGALGKCSDPSADSQELVCNGSLL